MNATAIRSGTINSIGHYRQLERRVFAMIPGMDAIRKAATEEERAALMDRYPDASFALMTASNLFCKDRELNAIHLKAYRAILEGEPVSNVRFRYDYDLEQYLERHLWDD
ncbi:MAG: hypothetical protein IKC09_05380 [Oscillospiraceae bacterium]|nr:hypothetical protein [Oscillospiraceae bacterium]MBR2889690.1 hypothetical protein [Oscillospiraceae bacterium]